MNASHKSPKIFSLSLLAAIAALSAASTAKAGPGIEYWTGLGQPKQEAAMKPAPVPASKVCTDSRSVAVTELRYVLPNGKGPMRSVQVGTKQTCDSCGATYTSMRPSWANGKGPLEAVQIKSIHDCDVSCIKR